LKELALARADEMDDAQVKSDLQTFARTVSGG
jgi:hypothetical protein